jgi:hypothetical protein
MKFLYLLLFLSIMIEADELDFLDEIDSDVSVFEEDKSTVSLRTKISFLKNSHSEDAKTFYLNARKKDAHYFYDFRIIADEDSQSFNVKELYYQGEFSPSSFYEVGRINTKEGVARGYNPTDYFKGTTSLTLSNDTKERKDNRLGAFLFSETLFLDTFTLKGIYSPKISLSKHTFLSDTKYIGLHLDETNYHDRASLYVDYSGFEDVTSSMILHYDEDDLHLGFNLSYVYSSWIFYVENSLKRAQSDIAKSIDAMSAHPLIRERFSKKKFYIDEVSVGLNYTSDSNIVTTLEYIHNSGGLDSGDWEDWFALGRQIPVLTRTLGALRGKSSKEESIMSQDSLFVFSRASDIQTNLDASFLAWVNPYDGSTLSQVGLEYAYDDSVQTNFYLRNYQGDKESEYGSFPNNYEILIEGEYFF